MTSFNRSWVDDITADTCPSCDAARNLPVASRQKMGLAPEKWEPDACMLLKTKIGQYTVCTAFLHAERRVFGGPSQWYDTIIFADRKFPDRPGFREWLSYSRGYAYKADAVQGHGNVVRMVESGEVEK